MTSDSITDYVAQAQTAAEAVTDPDLKLKTYELVLTHLLSGGSAAGGVTGQSTPPGSPHVQTVNAEHGSALQKISNWLAEDATAVSELMDLDADATELKLPTSKLPSKIADAQRLLVLLKLALDKQGFGIKSVPARTLVELCKEYSCADRNFAANIKDYDDYISSKGARGKMKVYEIRLKGLEKAKDELKALIGS